MYKKPACISKQNSSLDGFFFSTVERLLHLGISCIDFVVIHKKQKVSKVPPKRDCNLE